MSRGGHSHIFRATALIARTPNGSVKLQSAGAQFFHMMNANSAKDEQREFELF